MMSGAALSCGVMEWIMPVTRFIMPSLISTSDNSRPMPGTMSMRFFKGPILRTCCRALWEIVQGEGALGYPGGGLGCLLGLESGFGFLDERLHVAHSEDAAGHAVGVEQFEVGELLSRGSERDGSTHDFLHRERCAASGVAVELGEDHPVEVQRLFESPGLRSLRPGRSWRRPPRK